MDIRTLAAALILLFVGLGVPMASNEVDVTQDLRILELMPRDQVVAPLAIDPAIPENFVARDVNGKQSIYQWVYLGPEETLKTYFEEKTFPREPILAVKLASGLALKAYGEIDLEDIQKAFQAFKLLSYKKGKWGELPYVLVEGDMDGRNINVAYVGDNQNGYIYTFMVIRPEDKKLEGAAVALWNRFIQETTELPEPLRYKCMGQEMHVGKTISDTAGRKLLVQAEYNEEKGLVQVLVDPVEGNIDFQFVKAEMCRMGGKWHYGDEMIKIDGSVTVEGGWVNSRQTISCLLQKTDQFSKPSSDKSFSQVFKVDEGGTLTPKEK